MYLKKRIVKMIKSHFKLVHKSNIFKVYMILKEEEKIQGLILWYSQNHKDYLCLYLVFIAIN